ncbi:MAG: hypothetical protein ACR2OM_14100, partial [Aestuariivirgaceae bacterium]
MPAAHAQDKSSSSNFETFEATPKAPRKEPGGNRQIVVEPKVPTQATPKAPPVASLNPPDSQAEAPPKTPEPDVAQKTPEATKQPDKQPDVQPSVSEETFAPVTKPEKK